MRTPFDEITNFKKVFILDRDTFSIKFVEIMILEKSGISTNSLA